MRKRKFVLAAGLAAVMMASACSSPSGETPTSAAETTEQTTEAETTEKETAKEETKEETKEESAPEETEGPESAVHDPVKIWGTITEVTDRAIYVDNESPNSSTGEIVLTIDPETTRILDGVNGFPVDLKDIEPGGFEAYLGPAMTMSLPPQAMPYVVIVNTPEGVTAAEYVIAADSIKEKDGQKVLEGKDGTEYTLSEEVSIIPFLTKQMVRLEDIEGESECLVWMNEEEKVDRIVLFNK